MPAGKRPQSNTMLYTLISFVGFFIVAAVCAVIFYVKAEDYRKKLQAVETEKSELANEKELGNIGKIVGAKKTNQTYLGTTLEYIDEVAYLVTGGPREETSAEVKIDKAKQQSANTFDKLTQDHPDIGLIDPNNTGLIELINMLTTTLNNTQNKLTATEGQLEDLQKRFDDAMAATREKEQELLAEKERFQQQVNKVEKDYEELRASLKQSTDVQVKTLAGLLEEEKNKSKQLNQDLLKTDAELKMTKQKMDLAQQKLSSIETPPDNKVAASEPDGKIIMIDDQTKIVHLDIGTDNHVYQGLTFSVYDRNTPIPKDGKGKAEIEVFKVTKNISAARIIYSQIKNPIVVEDIVANLIWDSNQAKVFTLAGEFDLNGDGQLDQDGIDKLKALIEKWGGKATEAVSVKTDFLVLGEVPTTMSKPTFEQIETDPMAMEKYEASIAKLARYKEVVDQAQALSIPVLNTERFLYFIGYKTQSTRVGAFM